MEKETLTKLQWACIILPGFITVSVSSYLSDKPVESDFSLLYFSVFWSVVSVTLGAFLAIVFWAFVRCVVRHPNLSNFSVLPFVSSLSSWGQGAPPVWLIRSRDISAVVATMSVAVAFGLIVAHIDSEDYVFERLRDSAGLDYSVISNKRPTALLFEANRRDEMHLTGDARPGKNLSDGEYARRKQNSFVELVDNSDARFAGWPRLYPVGDNLSSVHLSPACVFDVVRDCWRRVVGPGVTVFERNIVHIMWIDDAKSACFKLWRRCNYCDEPDSLKICQGEEIWQPSNPIGN